MAAVEGAVAEADVVVAAAARAIDLLQPQDGLCRRSGLSLRTKFGLKLPAGSQAKTILLRSIYGGRVLCLQEFGIFRVFAQSLFLALCQSQPAATGA